MATKQSSVGGTESGLFRRFAPRNDEVYPRMIVTVAGPTIGAV
jgi:hypothetical protein